eukprot:6492168-Amphidinium_carterae.3
MRPCKCTAAPSSWLLGICDAERFFPVMRRGVKVSPAPWLSPPPPYDSTGCSTGMTLRVGYASMQVLERGASRIKILWGVLSRLTVCMLIRPIASKTVQLVDAVGLEEFLSPDNHTGNLASTKMQTIVGMLYMLVSTHGIRSE